VNVFNDPEHIDGLKRLARGVVARAAFEAKHGNPEAADFLYDPETCDTWLFMADLDTRMILAWLNKTCKRWQMFGAKTK
jgi:hypothetical protein